MTGGVTHWKHVQLSLRQGRLAKVGQSEYIIPVAARTRHRFRAFSGLFGIARGPSLESPTMTVPERPKRLQECAFRPIGDDGGLVVLPGRAEVKVLNPVAIKVFALLDGGHSVDVISAAVADEFDVSLDDARADVVRFVDQLDEHGMLEHGTPAGAREPDL